MAPSTGAEAAVEAVEREIKEVKTSIKKVERDIIETEAATKTVEVQLSEVIAQLRSPYLSEDVMAALLKKEEQLCTKEQQLRVTEQQLRTKEQQLREQLRMEKLELRKKEDELRKKEQKQAERYLKLARVIGAPSKVSLKREQCDPVGPLINNWRPTSDAAAGQLPELVHPVFARALEAVAGGTELDEATLVTAARLCSIGGAIYDDEARLTSDVRHLLKAYLEDGKAVTIESGFAANEVSPDWALGDSPTDPFNLFLVMKNMTGIGGSADSHDEDSVDSHYQGSGDSHFQGAIYHLQFWRQRTDSDAFRNTCCPAFLLEVVGPHVRLSAMAWLDRVTIFPLTPLLNLLPAHPVTDVLLMPVARLLAALRTGLRELAAAHAAAADATAAATLQQPAAARKELALPWPIRMDPRYDAAAARRLVPRNPTYYVSLAGKGGGEGKGGGGGVGAVVVKLCRTYGLEAHRAWAELGLAPKVLRVEPLPAGWQLLEMEWLPGPEWRRLSELRDGELGEALVAVQEALESAHRGTGMVHGDARPPNCLVRRDAEGAGAWQVRFIDFEWAGREGEATYPAFLNPAVPWPEGVGYGKQLQRAHDCQLLAAIVGQAVGSRGPAR